MAAAGTVERKRTKSTENRVYDAMESLEVLHHPWE